MEKFPELPKYGLATAYFPSYNNSDQQFHKLDVTLVSVVVNGSCTHLIGGNVYEQYGPSIGITPRGVPHCIISDGDNIEIYNLYLNFDKLILPLLPPPLDDALLMLFPLNMAANRIPRVNLKGKEGCIEALDAMNREFYRKETAWTTAVCELFKLFLIGACRGVLTSGIQIAKEDEMPGQFRIERVRRKLDRDFRDKISLKQLAKLAGLNRNYLCRAFRRYAGKTIFDYLLERRIQAAMLQLRQSNEKIISTAYECGFRDLSHFNRTFKRIAGKTPFEYRQSFKN